MPFLILIGGLIVVRLCAKISEEWDDKIDNHRNLKNKTRGDKTSSFLIHFNLNYL